MGCDGTSAVRLHGAGWGQSARVWKAGRRGGTHRGGSQLAGDGHVLQICGVSRVRAGWGGTHLGEVGALGHGAGGIDVKDVLALDREGLLLEG